jgi:hypothetical protein
MTEKDLAAMSAELQRETPTTYASREKRLPPAARAEWFDGFCNTIIPYENEMAPQNRPLCVAITEEAQSNVSKCFEYDSRGLLQAVRRSPLSSSRFVTLVERDTRTATAFTFNIDDAPKATVLSRVWFEGERVTVAARVSEQAQTVWTYHYAGGQVSSVHAVKGTPGGPVKSTVDFRFDYAEDGTLDRIYGVSTEGKEWECYRRPPSRSQSKSKAVKKGAKAAKEPELPAKELRSAFSAELGVRVEAVLKEFKQKGVVAVELVYSSSPWDIPSLGVLLESNLAELPERGIWNPAEWEHYDTDALEFESSQLEELARDLRAAGDDSLEETLVVLCKRLTPRLKKVLNCGSFFACFPCNVSAPPRGQAVAQFFSKADQKVLAAKGLL